LSVAEVYVRMKIEKRRTEVLVVGSGAAGLRAALEARSRNVDVTLVTKHKLGSGCSAVSSCGHAILVPEELGGDPKDTVDAFYEDTIAGGVYISDRRLVKILVRESTQRVLGLERLGVRFHRTRGRLSLNPGSGDHSYARNVRCEPRFFLPPLINAVRASGVRICERIFVTDLCTHDGIVDGSICLDTDKGSIIIFEAKSIVLATGGAGQLWLTSRVPRDITGDGYAIAYRAGCELIDMEFTQFYPWRLVWPDLGRDMPIQPATFFYGGRLRNAEGEFFMERYDNVRKDSTTRDVAARAIYSEVKAGRGVRGGAVVDISNMQSELFEQTNQNLCNALRTQGYDPRSVEMVVFPATHFSMGGIMVNEWTETAIEGLYVAGEAMGGIHGANRLACNALTACQVFGARAGIRGAERAKNQSYWNPVSEDLGKSLIASKMGKGAVQPKMLADRLRATFEEHVYVIRTGEGLNQVIDTIKAMQEDLPYCRGSSAAEIAMIYEVANMLQIGEVIARSALLREESRGAHYRQDYPNRDDHKWLRTIITKLDGNKPRLTTRLSSCAEA